MRLAPFLPNLAAAVLAAGVMPVPAAWAGLTYHHCIDLGEGLGALPVAVACAGDDHLFALLTGRDGKPALAHFHGEDGRFRRSILADALGSRAVALGQGPGRSLLVVEGDGTAYVAEPRESQSRWTLVRTATLMAQGTHRDLGLGNTALNAFAAGPDGSMYLAYGRRILRCRLGASGAVSHELFGEPEPSAQEPAPMATAPRAVDLEGPVSLAVDGGGRVYLLDRGQGSITAYPSGGGEGTEHTPQWGIEGFAPRNLMACGGQLVVSGTAPGRGGRLSMLAFTPAPDGDRILLGEAAGLELQPEPTSCFCLTPKGHLLYADPKWSKVRLWFNAQAEPKDNQGSAGPAGKLPPSVELKAPASPTRREAGHLLSAPAAAPAGALSLVPGPQRQPAPGFQASRPFLPAAAPERAPARTPDTTDLQPVALEARASKAGFLAACANPASLGHAMKAWLQQESLKAGRHPFSFDRLLGDARPGQLLRAPGKVPPGIRRFALDGPVLQAVVAWVLKNAPREANTGTPRGHDRLRSAHYDFAWYENLKGTYWTFELRDLSQFARQIDADAGSPLVAEALRARQRITGIRSRTAGACCFTYGLRIMVDLQRKTLHSIHPDGLVADGHPVAPVMDDKEASATPSPVPSLCASSSRSLASSPASASSNRSEVSVSPVTVPPPAPAAGGTTVRRQDPQPPLLGTFGPGAARVFQAAQAPYALPAASLPFMPGYAPGPMAGQPAMLPASPAPQYSLAVPAGWGQPAGFPGGPGLATIQGWPSFSAQVQAFPQGLPMLTLGGQTFCLVPMAPAGLPAQPAAAGVFQPRYGHR